MMGTQPDSETFKMATLITKHHRDTGETDAALLDRFNLRADDAAFGELVSRHGALVLGVCRRILGDLHAAEDAFQATFLVLARRARVVPTGALAGWLHGVAYRTALKARTRRRDNTVASVEVTAPAADPLEQLSARELLGVIDEEIQRLPANLRLTVILCCLEGQTQEEAAHRLSCSPGAVKGRLERGRAKLHARLMRRGLTLWAALAAVEWSRAAQGAVLPAPLATAALYAAHRGVSPAAATLAQAMLRQLAAARSKSILVVFITLVFGAAAATGLVAFAASGVLFEIGDDGPPPPSPQASKQLKDRHGDALPPGALARLGTVRLRSTAHALSVMGDGRIMTVSGGRTVARWDADTGALLGETVVPGGTSNRSVLSPDGKTLATYELEPGQDAGVSVWDVATGKRLHFFAKHWGPFAFTPDSKTLATAEYDSQSGADGKGTIHLWDVASGKGRRLAELPSSVRAFAFAPDGTRLYAVIDNHWLRAWEIGSGKQLWQNGHAATTLVVAADGKTLLTDTYLRGPLHLWDADTGKPLVKLDASKDKEYFETAHVALSPDGKYAAQATWADTLVWDLAARKVVHRLPKTGPHVAFAADSKSLYTAGRLLLRWDVKTGKLLYTDTRADGHVGQVASLVFSPDGRSLATTGDDGTVRVWTLADTSHRIFRQDGAADGARQIGDRGNWGVAMVPVRFTPDGRCILTDIDHDKLALTDFATGKEIQRFQMPEDKEYFAILTTTRITDDGKKIVALAHAHERQIHGDLREQPPQPLCVWDAATGKVLLSRKVKTSWPAGVLSPDGRLILAPFGKLMAVRSEGERQLVDAPIDLGPPLAFSPDGRLLVATDPHPFSSPAKALRIYETLTGRLIRRIEEPLGYCRGVAFSPDGRLLAAIGRDALHVWESATGKRVLHLGVKNRLTQWDAVGFANCLAFAPDGKSLATGHTDSTVLLWDLGPALAALVPPAGPVDAEACWTDLAAEDAAKAQSAIERLASAPDKSLPLLKQKLRPVVIEPKWLASRLEELGDEKFAVRQAAMRDLEKVADAVESELRKLLENPPSQEVRARLLQILKTLEAGDLAVPPLTEVRNLRAVAVLERLASADALAILRDLAAGAPDAALTRAARGALERVDPKFAKR
jgi:RNA polymerase sigma factor (sigma-70 family)